MPQRALRVLGGAAGKEPDKDAGKDGLKKVLSKELVRKGDSSVNFVLIALIICLSVMASLLIIWASIRAFNGIMEEIDVFHLRFPGREPYDE